MLHHNRINDVTQHVTQGYTEKEFRHQNAIVKGESTYSHNGAANKKYYNERHSTDVDDGVNSSDGDYDAAGYNLEALETLDRSPRTTAKEKSSGMRLSHAESTDSGMGFNENLKEGDTSRLSAGDGYGTIHLINPPPMEEPESRKSILDGDVEYDEVIDFISSPTKPESLQDKPKFSTFKTPPKPTQDDTAKNSGDSASKYADLDVAKILHTRRRHRHASTLGRRLTEEEKQPDENPFNSLKRKSKSKNYSISTYGTYGRNRKQSKHQTSECGSRPPSTYDENGDTIPVRSGSVSAAFHRRSSKGNGIENTFGHYNTLNPRRNNYSNDLMMTSDVSDEFMNTSATIDRTMWNHSHTNGLSGETDDSMIDVTNGSNRWSWLSNSSHSQSLSNEKTPPSSKSPWKIFRRLLGGRDKRKSVVDGRISTPNLSSTKPRSASLFRRLSMRKSGKNQLGKRRNSVPAKSEWDVQYSVSGSPDMNIHMPVIDAGKQRPTAAASAPQPTRGRLSSRLLSFRGGKNRSSKRRHTTAISKGLSISSPQLSVNAINPTRNYSEHQLLDLDNLTISDGKK